MTGRTAAGTPGRHIATAIRAVHSAIFAIELGAIVWLVYTGAIGRRDRTVRIAAGLVAAEGVVWLANDRVCPLTPSPRLMSPIPLPKRMWSAMTTLSPVGFAPSLLIST